jgi:uncharacterized protein
MRYKPYIVTLLVLVVLATVYVVVDFNSGSVINDPEGFKRDQEEQVRKNNENILKSDESVVFEGGEREDQMHPVSIQALQRKDFDGRDFTVGSVLEQTTSYTKYYISYKSGELSISGTMSVPKSARPEGGFPVVFTNHGYIDPAIYTNGRGLRREGAYLASQGFVVVHSDYRNHAQSSKDPENETNIRLGYIEDVVNAVYALKSSGLEYINKNKIGMLGHSMGGGIAQGVMVVQPELVDAFVLYAPVSMDARASFRRWTESRPETAQKIREKYGAPEQNPEFWDNVSPISFISEIKSPITIFHGTADADVPIEWSRTTRDALVKAGKSIELIEYPGQPHEFTTAHTDFMRRTTEFFREYLR